MLIPAYYDALIHLEGSVPMRGDDPRHDEHFTVDGTLLEAWASHKSYDTRAWVAAV
jgi:hypothetical protein